MRKRSHRAGLLLVAPAHGSSPSMWGRTVPASWMELEGTLMRFAIVVHKDEGSSYGLAVPDLPGCFSGADTLDDAFVAAQETVLLHLDGMLADGEPLPCPRPIQEPTANEDYRNGV